MFYTAMAGPAEESVGTARLIILACLVQASKFDGSPHKESGRHNTSYQPPPPATSHQPPALYKRQCYHCVIHYYYVPAYSYTIVRK